MEQINLKNYPERFALCGLPIIKMLSVLIVNDAQLGNGRWKDDSVF